MKRVCSFTRQQMSLAAIGLPLAELQHLTDSLILGKLLCLTQQES